MQALSSLGFSKEEALQAMENTINKGTIEQRVTLALKALNKK